jgi:hypothetical protein
LTVGKIEAGLSDEARCPPTPPARDRGLQRQRRTEVVRPLGAGSGQVVDHDLPLAKRYWKGDPLRPCRSGGPPGCMPALLLGGETRYATMTP